MYTKNSLLMRVETDSQYRNIGVLECNRNLFGLFWKPDRV
jgi:hypothetical protein